MAATAAEPVANAFGEVEGYIDGCISPEDLSWIRKYASQCKGSATISSSDAQLQRFNEVLCRAAAMTGRGEGIELVDELCELLHGVIRRATDDDIAAEVLREETSRTYEYTLVMLSSPKKLPLASVALLLRMLSREIRFRKLQVRPSIDLYMPNITFSKDRFGCMCSDLLVYLNNVVPEMHPKPGCSATLLKGNLMENHERFSDVVASIHTIAGWGLSHYGSSPQFADVRGSLRKLQENVLEQLIDRKCFLLACIRIGAAMKATTTYSGNETLFSLQWLEEKRIIWKLLNVRYDEAELLQVQEFVRILGKTEVELKENDFLNLMRAFSKRPLVPPYTHEICKVADQIHKTMLEELDISEYSDNFLDYALEWLETRQASFLSSGFRIINLGKKLLKNDKNRRLENRFCTLFRGCARSVPNSQLVECLKEVADHYNTCHVTGSSERTNFLEKDDEQAKLLEACSSADKAACISTDLTKGALACTEEQIQRAESWNDIEIELHVRMNASSMLMETLLPTNFPYTRHETAKKCLERLKLAKQMSAGLNPNKSYCSTFASVIAGAMSAELQTLEALKFESLLHCNLVKEMEELGKRHARDYRVLKREQYKRLVRFAEACRKEREDMVWNAFIQKTKVLASVERACGDKDKEMTSEDILKRLVVNAEGACMQMEVKLWQMEDKHKKSLERLLNDECAVCFEKFSKKRKRACLDPCGHASACSDCATHEWKRTKTCFVCKASIEKPIPVPNKLFF